MTTPHTPDPRELLQRSTTRITVTVPDHVFRGFLDRSFHQGRSVSNLAAYLLERAIDGPNLSRTG